MASRTFSTDNKITSLGKKGQKSSKPIIVGPKKHRKNIQSLGNE